MILVDGNGGVGAHGLNAGLNKGLKIGRALKKASKQISLKNAIKVAPMIAAGVATGGAGGVGLAVLKKGALKTAGKALIKKVATGAGRKALIKTAGKALVKKALPIVKAQATKIIANKNGVIKASNEVVVSEPVGDLTPVRPVETDAEPVQNETTLSESEPVGDLTPVKPVGDTLQDFAKESTNAVVPTESKPNYLLYGGIGLGVLALGYFATKKAN